MRISATARAAKPRRRWRRIVAWTSAVVAVLVLGAGAFAYGTYKHYDGRIKRQDVLSTNDPNIKDPVKQQKARNFLLIGSDTRSGANSKYENSKGQIGGERSDTTILAHLSPSGGAATMVSFPRDSWVHVPACKKSDGTTTEPYDGRFNSAFELGGPACTIKLIQSLTGIAIKHFVQVDFTGFKTMVSALDGITVCSPEDVSDSDSGLVLHKGNQILDGEQALAYVRARYNIGDGSDLGRIERQQRFLGAMIRKATSNGVLFNPGKLKSFLDAATKSVTLDTGTHLKDLYSLASQLKHLDAQHVHFYTAPIANRDYSPPGTSVSGAVLLDMAAGEQLWSAIINDSSPKTPTKDDSPDPEARPTVNTGGSKTTLTVPPSKIKVQVVNGTGEPYLATHASEDLHNAGFQVDSQTIDEQGTTNSVVRYAAGDAAAAKTLVAAVPGAVMQLDATVPVGLPELVVGSKYQPAHSVHVSGEATPKSSNTPSSSGSPLPYINGGDTSCKL